MFEIRARKEDVLGMKRLASTARNGHLECLKYAHENGVLGMI